ncbi:DUF1684 domain-containing protein [Nocardia sp. NPDC059246]|uniref:DUF1684 domain-containing protein n=1 Tax=unclassified Nocardia TaxID=2637762 RepID=UPI003690064B
MTDKKVFITAGPVDRLFYNGTGIAGVQIIRPVDGGPRHDVQHRNRVFEVTCRDARYLVRVHDPEAPALAEFAGVPSYAPDPNWVVSGQFVPYAKPATMRTETAVGGLEYRLTAVGLIEFTLEDRPQRLVVFDEPDGPRVLFSDPTNGVTTHAAGRSIALDAPTADGAVQLDFNRAVNPDAAFTSFTTCPLPPAMNHLEVEIRAGERNPQQEGSAQQ